MTVNILWSSAMYVVYTMGEVDYYSLAAHRCNICADVKAHCHNNSVTTHTNWHVVRLNLPREWHDENHHVPKIVPGFVAKSTLRHIVLDVNHAVWLVRCCVDTRLSYTSSAVKYSCGTGWMSISRFSIYYEMYWQRTRSCHSACCCRSRWCARLGLVDKTSTY